MAIRRHRFSATRIKRRKWRCFQLGCFLGLFFTPSLNAIESPDFLWARRDGGTNWDYASDIGLDSATNYYVIGRFFGGCIFGTNTIVSHGDWDMFLAKYNSAGVLLWVNQAGGSG